MQRNKILFLIACIYFIPQASFSQNYRILHWGIEQGLSQGINQKIIRDKAGFLWITSYEGVNRFDGKTFRNFYSSPKKRNSIRGIETVGLVMDSLNNIWIGSGDGLNKYDPVKDSVISFSGDRQSNNRSFYIVPVFASQDEVFCFEISGSLVAYDVRTHNRRIVTNNVSWYGDYVNVNNSWFDKDNSFLWMPASHGVVRIELKTSNTEHFYQDEQVNAVVFNPSNSTLLLGTDDGILEWDIRLNKTVRVTNLLSTKLGKITALAVDGKRTIWVGTEEHGLFIVNQDGYIAKLVKSTDRNTSLAGNKINTIFCDNTGIVWVGVATNGLNQLIPGHRFIHYSENIKSENSLNNNIVRCFFEDNNKNIWIATQGGGINVFNPQTQQFIAYNKKKIPGLPFDFIRYMVNAGNNTALIGTEKGMCWINTRDLSTRRIKFYNVRGDILPDAYIEQIVPYIDDSWLIATKEFGLLRINKGSDSAMQLPYPGNKHVFYTAFTNNTLFISVWDQDPRIFSVNKGEWTELKKEISTYIITFVLHDEQNRKYWIGTLKGLLETDEDLNILRHYTTDDGLSNHYIYAMIQDKEGLIWISTNKGLSSFDTSTRFFKTYTPADGLQEYEYNAKAGYKSSDNTLYFGGINGFDVIREIHSPLNNESPKFYIRQFLVNNIPYNDVDDINYVTSIKLPYSGNNITIQSSVIDFVTGGNNKIRYRLQGSDDDWKTADRDFVINYSGLAPGNYTFMATAANINNEWNKEMKTLGIYITKPWWQTSGFRIILGVLAAGIIILISRFYYQRKLEKQKVEFEKQQAIEHERTRIATDMHDDFGAGLSKIKFLSETIGIKKQQEISIEEDISKIKQFSNEMIDKMGEIVWALNEKNDSVTDLISYMRAYSVEYLSQMGIHCRVDTPELLPSSFVSGEFRRNIFLSVKEVLHNIVKHARASEVFIKIDLNHNLVINLKDNGVGFNPENIRPFSNGISNIQQRMGAIGGSMSIDFKNGTMISLQAPFPA